MSATTRQRLRSAGTVLAIVLLGAAVPVAVNVAADANGAFNCSAGFQVDETLTNGARWQMCWEKRAREGIVIHDVTYTPIGGQPVEVLSEAALAQIHVPYDDNGARFHDLSDFGLGGNMDALECRRLPQRHPPEQQLDLPDGGPDGLRLQVLRRGGRRHLAEPVQCELHRGLLLRRGLELRRRRHHPPRGGGHGHAPEVRRDPAVELADGWRQEGRGPHAQLLLAPGLRRRRRRQRPGRGARSPVRSRHQSPAAEQHPTGVLRRGGPPGGGGRLPELAGAGHGHD